MVTRHPKPGPGETNWGGAGVAFIREMKLADFLRDLLEKGKVTVAGQIGSFGDDDLRAAETALRRYYDEDALDMPGVAPAFLPEAALWGARYFYHAVQLAVLRDLGEEVVRQYLRDYPGPRTPEAVYSVDLTFRYLPDLLRLARGLAPGDVLVAALQRTALDWPFSSVGGDTAGNVIPGVILEHPSLRTAYVDRIIREKDAGRLTGPGLPEHVRAALGGHAAHWWPEFESLTQPQ